MNGFLRLGEGEKGKEKYKNRLVSSHFYGPASFHMLLSLACRRRREIYLRRQLRRIPPIYHGLSGARTPSPPITALDINRRDAFDVGKARFN
jgi:hypothetical protein